MINISLFVGFLLFLMGGVYQGTLFGRRVMLDLSEWGYAFIPAVLIGLRYGRKSFRQTKSWMVLKKTWNILERNASSSLRRTWMILLVPLFFLYVRTLLSRHWSFNSDWDLAIYANACANGFYSSLRDERTLLADHFEPILGVLIPMCKIAPDPSVLLLVLQVLLLFVGAAGMTVLCRRMKWSSSMSILVGLAYVFFQGHRTIVVYDFHLVGFALGLIPWLFVSLLDKRWWMTIILTVICFGLKESTSLTVAAIGIWLVLESKQNRELRIAGCVMAIAGASFFVLVMGAVFPQIRGGAESQYFVKYYGHLGGSLRDVLETFIFKPQVVFSHLWDPNKALYLIRVLLPFLFLPLIRPIFLVPILPALAINLLSSDGFLYSAGFHYEAEIYPVLFALTVIGSRDEILLKRWCKLPKIGRVSYRLIWLVTLVTFFGGKSLLWYGSSYPVSNLHIVIHEKLHEMAPTFEGKKVAAFATLLPHLTFLRNIFLLNRWQDADWVIVAYPHGKNSWASSYEMIESQVVPNMSGSYELVYQDKWYPTFRIWKKISPDS